MRERERRGIRSIKRFLTTSKEFFLKDHMKDVQICYPKATFEQVCPCSNVYSRVSKKLISIIS